MPVQLRAVTTPSQAAANSHTINKPTGTVDGDLVFLVAYQGSVSNSRYELPDGFVEVPLAYMGGSNGIQIFMRVAASEPSTYTVFLPNNVAGVVLIGAAAFYSDSAEPVYIEAIATLFGDVAVNVREWPTVDVLTASQMLFYVGAFGQNTGSTPSSGTERWDTSGTSPRAYAITEPHSGAGTTPVVSATANFGLTGTFRNLTIALAEGAQALFDGPQYRATGDVTSGTVDGSQSADIPASVEVGDLLITHLSFGTDKTPTLPAGWLPVPDGLSAGGNSLHSYYKVAEDGDAGASVTATFAAGSTTVSMAIHAWYSPRGYALEIAESANQTNGAGTSHSYPTLDIDASNAGLAYLLSTATSSVAPQETAEHYDDGSPRLFLMTELTFAAGESSARVSTSGASVTSRAVSIAIVEVEPPCDPGSSYSFDGFDITVYCNELDLQTVGVELEATHMGSEGEEAEGGLTNHSVRLGGDWSQAVDDLLGQAALSGARRTGTASFDDCTTAATYTWVDAAYITGWQVFTVAAGKMGWRAVLRHSGVGVRTAV